MPIYDVVIPGRGSYEVESEKDLTDKEAYQYALSQASQEGATESLKRGAGLATRAIAPTLLGAQIGSAGGPIGSVLGSMALPAADALNALVNLIASPFTDKRLIPASQAVQNLMTSAGVPAAPETQTPTERVVSTGLEALAGTARTIPEFVRRGAELTPTVTGAISRQMAVAPKTQAIVSPTATMVGQTVTEATGSPLAGIAATIATGTAGSIKKPQKEQALPTATLDRIAADRYAALEQSGIKLDTDAFASSMDDIAKGLRSEGYTPKAYPKISGAIDELTSKAQPKDWTEIQALRKMIRAGQKSVDPDERRLASILLDDYDNYLLTAPKSDIVSGDIKEFGKTWDEARNAYSRMKKAEIFEDMLDEAKLDRSKFTQSGEENSLAKQLRQLAKNDKKMRTFTSDERKAIEDAAKGGTMQNLLKFFGRFAPTGPVSGLFTGGATAMAPAVGIPAAIGAAGSRVAATNMRRGSVEELANIMRMGAIPQVAQDAFGNVIGGRSRAIAPTTIRGLLSLEDLDEQQRNLMGIR